MRFVQVVVVLLALFACGGAAKAFEDNDKTSTVTEERATTTTRTVATANGGTITFPSSPTSGGINVANFRGGTITFETAPNNDNAGGTVTVTTYHNDGLWQRIKKWWKKLLGREERLRPADRAAAGAVTTIGAGGIASRIGTGGTVAINDNNNGGGSVTVTVFNNNGLYARVQRWWKRIIARLASLSTRRLRQLE